MTYYQVVNIGTAYTTTSLDIGLDDDRISIVSEDSIDKSLPTVYLYWGKSSCTKTYQGSLNLRELAADNMIIPVIDDSTDFMKSIPDELAHINALIIKSGNYAIVGNWILKHFGLYEATNKVFISYRRSDTSMLAHQLFERLIEAGYTPFLDCYSIESGVDFQEYLRNEIVDADVFVYLNSPHYNESPYTIEERDCAQKLSLGIVQVTFNEVSTDISVMNSSNIALGLDANPIFIYNSDVIDRILVEIEKKRAVMFEYRRKALVNSYRLLNERDCLCIRADVGNNDRALLLLLRMAVREEVVDLPADIDWREIKERAFRQGVGGIVFDVVEKLPAGQRPPKEVVLEWMGMVMRMERMYEHHRQVIARLAAFYAEMGVRMLLLKGYGLSLAWPVPKHRPTGDIDIFLFGKQQEADERLQARFGVEIDNSHHKHSVFQLGQTMVENHYSFLNVHAHRSTAEIEAILQGQLDEVEPSGIVNVSLPSARFNSLYLLRHSGEHFASVDISLRIVLDWAFYVRRHPVDWPWLLAQLDRVGMRPYLAVLNAICVRYLGFEASVFPDLPVEEALVDRSIQDILVPEVEPEEHKNRMREVAFRFRRWYANRWKHDMVYRERAAVSLCTQLWSHVLKPSL